MEGTEGRQPWLLIGVAVVALLLGGLGLIVAMDAKSASDDAASQDQVDRISGELSRLVDTLGIAESNLTGQESKLQDRANRAEQKSRNAVVSLSNRLERLERQTAALQASVKQTTKLSGEVGSLQKQVKTIDGEISSLNQRLSKLTKRVNGAIASTDGGQSVP